MIASWMLGTLRNDAHNSAEILDLGPPPVEPLGAYAVPSGGVAGVEGGESEG